MGAAKCTQSACPLLTRNRTARRRLDGGTLSIAGIDEGNHCRCGTPGDVAAATAHGLLLPAAVCDAPAYPCTGVCCGPTAKPGCTLGKCTGKPDEHCGNKGALMAYTYTCG